MRFTSHFFALLFVRSVLLLNFIFKFYFLSKLQIDQEDRVFDLGKPFQPRIKYTLAYVAHLFTTLTNGSNKLECLDPAKSFQHSVL